MADNVELGRVSLSGDDDGFLSRQCPSCARIFKCPISRMSGDDAPTMAYCPYCGFAAEGSWNTDAQATYLNQHAQHLATQYVAQQFREMLDGIRSQHITVTHGDVDLPPDPGSSPSQTPEGFTLVHVPCHPDDPLKIGSSWSGEVACPLCGIPYPMGDVADLGGPA